MSTLRAQIADRLGAAWPDLRDDPVYLDQLAAQAEIAISNHDHAEAVRLRAELEAKDAEIARLTGLLNEVRRPDTWCSHQHITMARFGEVVAEKLNFRAQRDEATECARQMIAERGQAEDERDRLKAAITEMAPFFEGQITALDEIGHAPLADAFRVNLAHLKAALDQPEDQ